jgi:hypothetical protein
MKSPIDFTKLVRRLQNGSPDTWYNYRLRRFSAWKQIAKLNPQTHRIRWDSLKEYFCFEQRLPFRGYLFWTEIDNTGGPNGIMRDYM